MVLATETVNVILENLFNAAMRGNRLFAVCLIFDVRWERRVKEILPSENLLLSLAQ